MSKPWLMVILALSLTLMLIQKSEESLHLRSFFKPQKTLKLKNFSKVKSQLSPADQDLLEIWESMLTGNTRPLNRMVKENFAQLGLRHLFTPSGLHLSALLYPTMKMIRGKIPQILILTMIAFCLFPLVGFIALKRMVLVKWMQKFIGFKEGFILALFLDVLFGSFQNSALSFTYSFLFLGIMYSGTRGLGRIFWFFIGQCLIAFSQGIFISPLLMIFSPFISFLFVLALPSLFLLSFPLLPWQLETGLFILRSLVHLITWSAQVSSFIPSWEMHIGFLALFFFLIIGHWKKFGLVLLFLCSSLNLDLGPIPSAGTNEFRPIKQVIRIVVKGTKTIIYFEDGKCERELVRGRWWEKCSPRRGSIIKSRKLSYPSSERRRSSLRG